MLNTKLLIKIMLKNLGFDIVEYKIVNKNNVAEAIKNFEKTVPLKKFATDGLVLTFNNILYSKSLGETSKFPKDSIVLTFNNILYSKSLGETSKFPKDSIAFKWQDDLA